ncbi:cupin domain-containing protein [Actinophytocola sp. NPDC049390]|uniref:cupin domain-containing protein n=1 Tax=Actinophytocola sp. NPDC049390 TaxID=3363894 RepID=UPI0037B2D284
MAGHTDNQIRIEAPFQLVWDITNDVPNWPDLFTEYAATDVLSEEGDTITFRLTMYPDDNGTVWSWVSERTRYLDEKRTHSHRIETGPFEYMNLDWYYEEVEGAVILRWVQDFHMKDTAPVDDEWMVNNINKNSKVQMQIIKDKIEKVYHSRRASDKKVVSIHDCPQDHRRGGTIQTLLSPRTVGSTSGFMGGATLATGEAIAEHLHPYSEEFVFCIRGHLEVDIDDEVVDLPAGSAILVPKDTRHRLRNVGDEEVFAVFHLGPLAPRPELGHVDTETREEAAAVAARILADRQKKAA